jgi:hypothetical protein
MGVLHQLAGLGIGEPNLQGQAIGVEGDPQPDHHRLPSHPIPRREFQLGLGRYRGLQLRYPSQRRGGRPEVSLPLLVDHHLAGKGEGWGWLFRGRDFRGHRLGALGDRLLLQGDRQVIEPMPKPFL